LAMVLSDIDVKKYLIIKRTPFYSTKFVLKLD
jgi:hypothetical protein